MGKRFLTVAEVRTQLASVFRQAQQSTVIVTHHGRPIVIIVGIADQKIEDLLNEGEAPESKRPEPPIKR